MEIGGSDQEKLGESWKDATFRITRASMVKSMAGARGGQKVKEKMMERRRGKGKQKQAEASTKASDQDTADTNGFRQNQKGKWLIVIFKFHLLSCSRLDSTTL